MNTLMTGTLNGVFNGHMQAKKWFYGTFYDRFILKSTRILKGEKIYYYYLITDQNYDKDGIKELVEKGIADGFELPMSYYIVCILEDGRVHVIY